MHLIAGEQGMDRRAARADEVRRDASRGAADGGQPTRVRGRRADRSRAGQRTTTPCTGLPETKPAPMLPVPMFIFHRFLKWIEESLRDEDSRLVKGVSGPARDLLVLPPYSPSEEGNFFPHLSSDQCTNGSFYIAALKPS